MTQRTILISKISNIIDSDVTVFLMEYIYPILVHGSNVFNDVSNELIISETIQYIKFSDQFKRLESFYKIISYQTGTYFLVLFIFYLCIFTCASMYFYLVIICICFSSM